MATKTTEQEIERLRGLAGELFALMEDPHPGLVTWRGAVAHVRSKIAPAPGPATGPATEAMLEWLETHDEGMPIPAGLTRPFRAELRPMLCTPRDDQE